MLKLSKGTLYHHNYVQLDLQQSLLAKHLQYWYNMNSVIYMSNQRLAFSVGLDLHD